MWCGVVLCVGCGVVVCSVGGWVVDREECGDDLTVSSCQDRQERNSKHALQKRMECILFSQRD